MNTHFKDKKQLWKMILLTLAAVAIYKILGELLGDASNELIPDVILGDFIWQAVMLVLAVAAAFIAKKLGVLKLSGAGFAAGLAAGAYMLFEGVFRVITWIGELFLGMTDISVPAVSIVLFIGYELMIGISEELLSRGVLFEGFLDYFGCGSVRSMQKAIVFSGCIFGLLHLANLTGSTNPVGTVIAATANMFTGMIYCTIYLRGRRNIWPCVLIHALKDASLDLAAAGILSTSYSSTAESSGATGFAGLLAVLIYLAVAMFVMRKKVLLPLVDEKTGAEA